MILRGCEVSFGKIFSLPQKNKIPYGGTAFKVTQLTADFKV